MRQSPIQYSGSAALLLTLFCALPAQAHAEQAGQHPQRTAPAVSSLSASTGSVAILQLRDERLALQSGALAIHFSQRLPQDWAYSFTVTGAESGFGSAQQDYLQAELGLSYRFIQRVRPDQQKTTTLSGEFKLGAEDFAGPVDDQQQYLSAALTWHSERDTGWISSFKWGYLLDNGAAALSRQGLFIELSEGYQLNTHTMLTLEYKHFQRQSSLGLSLTTHF